MDNISGLWVVSGDRFIANRNDVSYLSFMKPLGCRGRCKATNQELALSSGLHSIDYSYELSKVKFTVDNRVCVISPAHCRVLIRKGVLG